MTLLKLGFRPFYLLAAVFAIVAVLTWSLFFMGKLQLGHYLPGTVWHSHEMVFGFFAAVLAGFLFTAVRNWTGQPTPSGLILGAIGALWVVARILIVSGPASLAALVDVLFLPLVTVGIAVPILRSKNTRNLKVIAILIIASLLHFGFHLSLAGTLPAWLSRPSLFATIDVIVILFALVGGRVIPAFTRNAVAGADPRHEQWLEVVAFASLILIAIVTLLGSRLDVAAWSMPVLLVIAAVAHLTRLALWQPQRTLHDPLLWMMPVAYSWLPLALFLRALSSAGVVAPGTWIHALTMGALSSLMLAMMMRSSLGHTGRKLAASRADMLAFLLLQAGTIVRIAGGALGDYRVTVVTAGVLWMLAFAVFIVRYFPMLTQPRIDGKPG